MPNDRARADDTKEWMRKAKVRNQMARARVATIASEASARKEPPEEILIIDVQNGRLRGRFFLGQAQPQMAHGERPAKQRFFFCHPERGCPVDEPPRSELGTLHHRIVVEHLGVSRQADQSDYSRPIPPWR